VRETLQLDRKKRGVGVSILQFRHGQQVCNGQQGRWLLVVKMQVVIR
jgi:hypothetical protein